MRVLMKSCLIREQSNFLLGVELPALHLDLGPRGLKPEMATLGRRQNLKGHPWLRYLDHVLR